MAQPPTPPSPMFSLITGEVLDVFTKKICVVYTTLPQIQQWCNFCIENPNLDFFVFVVPTTTTTATFETPLSKGFFVQFYAKKQWEIYENS